MFNFIFGNKATIDNKVLEQNNINIISRKDLILDKNSLSAITGSGRFYKGTYKGEPVSIKVKTNLFRDSRCK
jgi:hypothetical protein